MGRCWGSLATWTPRRWCCGSTCRSHSGLGAGRHDRLGYLKAERRRTDRHIDYWVTESMKEWLGGRRRRVDRTDGKCETEDKQGKQGGRNDGWRGEAIISEKLKIWGTLGCSSRYIFLISDNMAKTATEKQHLSCSLPLILCARAKPSSMRKKSIQAAKKRDITH